MAVKFGSFWEILFFGYLDGHYFSMCGIYYYCRAAYESLKKSRFSGRKTWRARMAARIQLVLQIDQGNLDGMRELASTDAAYINSEPERNSS